MEFFNFAPFTKKIWPKAPSRRSKTLSRRAKMFQEHLQDFLKTPQEAAKTGQNQPEIDQRASPDASTWSLGNVGEAP